MDLLNNIGISYKGDYIVQGSLVDKCKKSNKLSIKNIELMVRNDGKDIDYKNLPDLYNGNIIFHLPSINVSQTNLKSIKQTLSNIMNDKIKLLTIDASTLLYDTYEWSTTEEQQNYLKNLAKGIAGLCSYKIDIAIENPGMYKNNLLFGKSYSNLSDLLVYVRNVLVEEYGYTREDAVKRVGISLNIGNLINTNEINNINNWLKVFYNDIKCIKISNLDNILPLLNQLLDIIIENEEETPIILETKDELEDINNVYNKFVFLIKNKLGGKPFTFDGYRNVAKSKYNEFNRIGTSQSGYTNVIITIMIILTIVIAVLMILVQYKR